MEREAGRDHDWADADAAPQRRRRWNASGWTPRTSATRSTPAARPGRPKGVQRDVGGYAVALAASMKHIFLGEPGETYFSTSDIGWVVGHSYIVYGPLIAGMATIMYEGLPIRPDAGVWWSLVEKYKVSAMFSAPTAVRVLKKQDPAFLKKYDLSSLQGAVPGRRAAGRTHRALDQRWSGRAHHRQLLADRERLADPDHRQRRREAAQQVRQPGRAHVRLRHQAGAREHRRGADRARREGRGGDRGPHASGLHADGLGRRRALRQHLLADRAGPAWSTAPSTGASATRTATSTSWAAPTT